MEQYLVQFPKLGLNLTLSREAFTIGGFSIYWYAIIIAAGMLFAVAYLLINSKKYGVDPDKLIDIIIVSTVVGIIGARAYYVVFSHGSYSSFWDVINIRDGGLAIYGAIIFGLLAIYVTSKINKTKFLPMLDLGVGGLLIGQAIGRWGNFVNQEAFGVNTSLPFGMYSEKTQEYLESVSWELFKQGVDINPSAPVHPCFLYESIWCIIGFVLLLLFAKKRKFDGEAFLFYVAWYGTGRAVIEGIRTDSLMLGSLRVSQVLSIVAVIVAVTLIVYFRVKIKLIRQTDPDYLMLYVNTEESRVQFADKTLRAAIQSEPMLHDALDLLNSAQKNLDSIVFDDVEGDEYSTDDALNEASDELACEQELSESADELTSPEDIFELIDKQIALASAKIAAASVAIDDYVGVSDENTSTDNAVAEGETTVESVFEQSAETDDASSDEVGDGNVTVCEDIEEINEKISSARAYATMCFEKLAKIKEEFNAQTLQSVPEEAENECVEEEIIDTVSDESDEVNEVSPTENK